MSSPYTEENYDLKMDAVMHFVTILTVFLILLIIARFLIRAIVGKIIFCNVCRKYDRFCGQ